MSLPERYNGRFRQTYAEEGRADFKTLPDFLSIQIEKSAEDNAYRCIGVHLLSRDENGGNHHIYIDVLDENGSRVNGAKIGFLPNPRNEVAILDKPPHEPGTNIPMWAATYTVWVDGQPSDKVSGFRYSFINNASGTYGHHSFYVVFQKRPIQYVPPVAPPPIVTPKPDEPGSDNLLEAINRLEAKLDSMALEVSAIKAQLRANAETTKQVAAVLQKI